MGVGIAALAPMLHFVVVQCRFLGMSAINGSIVTGTRGAELAGKIAFLSRPDAYPGQPAAVEVIHTHMSCVFLTDRHAYKLKKPIRTGFLDFSTTEARRHDSEEELRLNRRLAPDVYLDTVPLTLDAQRGLQLGGSGATVDWLVRMRRLPAQRMLDAAIHAKTVTAHEVRRFTSVLSDFYRSCEPVAISEGRYRERFEQEIESNHRELSVPRYGMALEKLAAVFPAQLEFLRAQAALLDARVRGSRIVEGHGDLRPEHVFLGEPPVFIDCLEFNPDWRLVDPVDEFAYLAMECEHAGAAWIGDLALATYSEVTKDDAPRPLIRFYKAYRAGLRAKLAAWHLNDHPDEAERKKWTARAASYLELARRYSVMLPA
jgi:uncharacterized protein